MSLSTILQEFKDATAQCDSLIANAHKVDAATGVALLPAKDQQQITIAAFLNLFIAWETFLEASLKAYMTNEAAINVVHPIKYVSPRDIAGADKIIIGPLQYFDYANFDYFMKIIQAYFSGGYPYYVPLSAIASHLQDMRTMRNSSAHISSTTQSKLATLAGRILGAPQPGITLYQLLTSPDARGGVGATVFSFYRDTLIAAAELIAKG